MLMKYIGYIRVSTVKQGTKGVSLEEQRDAILRYAERHQFTISIWLEEMETAAKQGRPIFMQAMKLLRQGQAQGLVLHKLDRGARNLKDWNDIAELSDRGIKVHFAHESLDLNTRGGRLSADIQAVVSADFIRHLREETRKGFYGRLKQGLYPLPAPIGYLNHGKGNPKTVDSVMGPLVRKSFELYATAGFNFETLEDEMYRRGLRNRHGGRVTRNGLSTMLNNPFYIGIIRINKTKESFVGIHKPLLPKSLFDRVHGVLTGNVNVRTQRHAFLFRRMLACAVCQYSLIGERQKGHVYYRCHSKQCHGTALREETVEAEVEQKLQSIRFGEQEMAYMKSRIIKLRETWTDRREDEAKNLNLRLSQIKDRLNRLTDAYLDQAIDKAMLEERRTSLLLDQKGFEESLVNLGHARGTGPDRLEKFLELAGNAWLSHQTASPEEKRELVNLVTSNLCVQGKKLELKFSNPFQVIASRFENAQGDPKRDTPRTLDGILDVLTALNSEGQLPDLSEIAGFQDQDTRDEISLKE